MKKLSILLLFVFSLCYRLFSQNTTLNEQEYVFSQLNLNYEGLESVKIFVQKKNYSAAAKALLYYYQHRTKVKHPDYNPEDRSKYRHDKLPKDVQDKADKGLEHNFFIHKGYGYFNYGKDINWQYWPVKDNEVRWQLHRMYWWIPMGLAYWTSGDEKYAKEWVFQYLDWMKKNSLGLSKENDRFAWRPLEVATRIQDQTALFNFFSSSSSFTPDFLLSFLANYYRHTSYILHNYSNVGNHLLFEAQRMIYAGCFFPEFRDAPQWRSSGIQILNKEINVQVYPDGLQFELSPNYHIAAVNIFLKALNMAKLANLDHEFPGNYLQKIESMIMAHINYTFPDYTFPMFSDAKYENKRSMIKQYKIWTEVFPNNEVIKYFATDGKKGRVPDNLSKGLTSGGFFTFRNGWNKDATVMVLKASPPAFWHSQPDNGTFDLWINGRNFMPDAGCYVYGGDSEIMKKRNWYRQSMVHKTLTVDNKNLDSCDAKLLRWQTGNNRDILRYENPSYKNLNHRRTVLFVDKKYFVILDEAIGSKKGEIGIHYQLADTNEKTDFSTNTVYTNYKDGNNLLIKVFGTNGNIKMVEEEGRVSYEYRQEQARSAYGFSQMKNSLQEVGFITVLYPFTDEKPEVQIKINSSHDISSGHINLDIIVNKKADQIRL